MSVKLFDLVGRAFAAAGREVGTYSVRWWGNADRFTVDAVLKDGRSGVFAVSGLEMESAEAPLALLQSRVLAAFPELTVPADDLGRPVE